jgi:predicted negative regulator of RcsB-dependent stress response
MASPDGESLEHFGDILFMNGKVNEAVTQWTNAKNAGGASSNINQKIANKKIDN